MSDEVRVSVRVPRVLFDELAGLAGREDRSVSWMVRRALEGLVASSRLESEEAGDG